MASRWRHGRGDWIALRPLHTQGFDTQLRSATHFGKAQRNLPDWSEWQQRVTEAQNEKACGIRAGGAGNFFGRRGARLRHGLQDLRQVHRFIATAGRFGHQVARQQVRAVGLEQGVYCLVDVVAAVEAQRGNSEGARDLDEVRVVREIHFAESAGEEQLLPLAHEAQRLVVDEEDNDSDDLDDARWLRTYIGKTGFLQLGFAHQGTLFLYEISTEWHERYQRVLETAEAIGGLLIEDDDDDE